uniref:Retrovirus-related Pol polyprotein LINE-1 n=1 Tax=Tanacetum cinerariifolium TaxID=118510 RepID=A0A6L2KGQ8_TANCI|nr:retrovirus-related Pol polyprotein LINE-1 [Tanacetum cinerariifolium]
MAILRLQQMDMQGFTEALVLEIGMKKGRRHKREAIGRPMILWKNLKGEAVETFRANVFEKLSALEDVMSARNTNQMWNTFAGVIKDVAKDSLGVASESARAYSMHRESWWFCKEVQTKVATKQSRVKELLVYRDGIQEDIDLAKEMHKPSKREAKIVVARAKDEAYEDLYKKLDSKEGANDIYNIAKARERKRRDIGNVRYIKDEGGRTIDCYYSRTNQREVRDALQRMGRNKAVGPDQIPIEALRCLEDEDVKWLTCLFNKVFLSAKMPDECRLSKAIPIYKNKGDAQACSNYRGIKLLSHTIKLWKRVIERRLRRETRVLENQFGFMSGRSMTEVIHLLKSLIEKYRERKRDLHMAFLDLEKAYDKSVEGLNNKIERWTEALEDNGLRVSREKMKYLRCDFGRLDEMEGGLRVAIRPAMLYGLQCWSISKDQVNKVEVAKLRMLRWTCGKTMLDMIPNGVFRAELDVDSIIDKMREGRLRWFRHVRRRPQSAPVRRVEAMLVEGLRRRGRPKLRWEDRIKQDMKELLLSEDITFDRNTWKDRIRISGPNGEALRKCILSGPYKPKTVLVQAIDATDDSPSVSEHTIVETPMNMYPENKGHFLAEKEAIHLILTGIGDDIYSTVDAFQTAQEMWEVIERLQQADERDDQDNLTMTMMQVNVQFLQQLQLEWSRFVTIVKQLHKLDEVSYHKLFDILKQYQNEVNELRVERLAKNVNPLALVATAQADRDQYYQTSRSHRSSAPSPKPSIPSRSHTTTRHKGKEIAKPITPSSEIAFEEDNDPEQAQRDKDMQKNLALIAKYFKKIYKPTNNNLRTSSNSKNKNVDTILRYKNDDQSGQFGNQRTVNVVAARENVGSKVVQQSGIQCFNCREFGHFTKECRKPKRVKDSVYHKEKMLMCKQAEQVEHVQNNAGYNVFTNGLQHSEQSESVSNTCLVETDDSNVISDSPDICEDDIQNEQNDVESDDERVTLANLITSLKLDTKQAEFEKYKAFNDRTIDYDKLKRKLNEALGQLAQKDTVIKEGLKTKAYELSVVKEKHDELIKQSLLTKSHYEGLVKQKTKVITDLKLREEHDIEKMISMEKIKVFKQSCLQKKSINPNHSYDGTEDAIDELQCLYLHKVKEYNCLAQKILKQTESASNVLRKERKQYIKIQDLKAKLQDKNIAISELKKLIEKAKGKFVDTKFDRPSVVRQPNAQRIPKPSVLGKPAPFSNSLDRIYFPKTMSVSKANVSEGLSKLVTAQTLPQTAKKAVSNTNVLKLEMYRINNRIAHTKAPQLPQTVKNTNPRVSTSTGVNHKPNVSRPRLKSNQSRDKVLPNNSQVKVKKTQVEVHLRILSVSNKMKSVNACKDSLNSKTLNSNVVYATCNKCLVDSNHFACVTKILNDVHARTKKPTVVPISARKPKSQANKSVATPHKKKVASKSTNKKPQSYFRVLYENTSSNTQDKQPSTNIPSTSAPSTHINVHAEENNNDKAEEGEQLQDNEFTNPLCVPAQDVAESSSHNIGNSNVPTFNQPQVSEYRWTKDHPLEQVHGNPSRPVQTRRQLATDPEMCMYAFTVSTAKPKNIKKAMADSVWIEVMQEELHQFDRLHVWELVDKPFGKMVIKLKWLWKNKKDEDQTVIRNKA